MEPSGGGSQMPHLRTFCGGKSEFGVACEGRAVANGGAVSFRDIRSAPDSDQLVRSNELTRRTHRTLTRLATRPRRRQPLAA